MRTKGTKSLKARILEFSRYAEIRQLAHNIIALQQKALFHSLAVLSALPEEGKTLACAALATAYTETSGAKVLVVDTTSYHSQGSLILKDCLASGGVEHICVAELRQKSPPDDFIQADAPDAILGRNGSPLQLPALVNSEFSIVKNVAHENPKQYGLVLLDTVPLTAKNRSNFDPLMIARMAHASVLVISRKFLEDSSLRQRLKTLEDPSLHLIGVVANEEFAS